MRTRFRYPIVLCLAIGVPLLLSLACGIGQAPRATQATEEVVPHFAQNNTQAPKAPCYGATVIVPVTIIFRPTQIVEVTGEPEVIIQTVEVERMIAPVTLIVQPTQLVEIIREVTREVVVKQTVIVERALIPAATLTPGPAIKETVEQALPVWYDFEGDFLASGVVEDRSGNGQDAWVNGSVGMTDGISGGQAISFTGDGYLQANTNPAAGSDTVSFSLWFKTSHPEYNYKFASAAWWQGGPASGWVLATHIPELWSDDHESIFMPEIANQENNFPADEWVHEVLTYDGERIKEYTNGNLVNDWIATRAPIGSGIPMVIGGWPYTDFYFEGAIDEFRIFNQALTLQQVQTLYNQR
jgi:hypothetical protein